MVKLIEILFSKTFLISLFFIGFNTSFAQTKEADSLVHALSIAIKDSERIYLMNELSSKLKDIDTHQSLAYAQKALKLSQQTNDKENEIKAMHTIGILVYDSEKIDSALAYFEHGERMAKELNLKELQVDHLMSLANWYRYYGADSTKSVNYLLKSVDVSKEANYHYGTARSYAKLASFYTRYKQILLVEEYLELSAEFYLKGENGGFSIAHYYNEVANKIWDYNPKKSMDLLFKGLKFSDAHPNIQISLSKAHIEIGEPQIALKYLEDALSNLDSKKKARTTSIALSQLADVHLQLGDHDAALKACDMGITLLNSASRSNRRALPALYRTKGHLMKINEDDRMALDFYKKSIEEAIRNNEPFEIVKANVILGNFHSLLAPSKAEQYCKLALKKASESNLTSLEITACDCLINIYKKRKAYSKALTYFERKVILNDSIGTSKIEHAIDINNRLAEKDKKLAAESYQKEIKNQQLKNKNIIITILMISSIFGLILIGFLFFSRKKISNQNFEIKRKTQELEGVNKNLAQSNEELERFAHVASHDLKSPLRTIVSFTELIDRKLDKAGTNSVKEWLGFIEKSGKNMSKLIDDILDYSKLSNQSQNQRNYEVVKVNELIDGISQLILINTDGKLIDIEVSKLPNLKWSRSKLFLLFKNLIENGLKYNESENPTVKIYFSKSKGIHSFYFEDNGIGIKQEDFDKIFIMFHRLHSESAYEGTGLGLATCKKIVEDFKGKITIKSTFGKGTAFIIEIPGNLVC